MIKIEELNKEMDKRLGQSSLLENWDKQEELPDPILENEDDYDSRPFLANMIGEV